MSQYTTPTLTIDAPNGTSYAYRRFGKQGGVPVVFMQHFRGNLDGWDPALVDDIAAEREVILFDASGIAGSTGVTPRTFRDFGRDALAFIDALGLDLIDLFGFSIGGFGAQEAALLRPQLVRRLILAGTGPQGGREMHGWNEAIRSHAYRDIQNADDAIYLFFADSDKSRARGAEFLGRVYTRTEGRDAEVSRAAWEAQGEAILDWGIPDTGKLDRLAGIAAPTLVANGDNDIMVPTVNSFLLAGHLPDARLVIYPDANHGFLFEFPHEFASEVNAFLAA